MANNQQKAYPKKVFVSSTFEDMKPYREKTMEALRSLQQTPIVMEDFGANTEPSIDVCRAKIQQSDIFVLIVGFKYGSIYDEGKSFVELEYEYALKLKKPILVFIVDDEAEIKVSLVDRGELAEKLENFKKKLKTNHTVKIFNTVDSLYGFVHEAIKQEIQRITHSSTSSLLEGKEALNAYKKFLLMPNRYRDAEAIISLRVNSGFSGWMLRDDLVTTLGLTLGDTVQCDVISVDDETNEMLSESLREIDLFADGENAEWLVDNVTHTGTILKVHVKFVCKIVRGITRNPDQEVLKVALIMIKGLGATPPDII